LPPTLQPHRVGAHYSGGMRIRVIGVT
jgi:hypothetical protein